VEHDLVGKPASTFPDHALDAADPRDRSDGLSLSSADLKSRDFRKILLIKLSAVGDVVHTIPVLNALRRRYPSAIGQSRGR
jgi:hypothetical protein